jgi:ribose 5-phosphate isomerase RpiB
MATKKIVLGADAFGDPLRVALLAHLKAKGIEVRECVCMHVHMFTYTHSHNRPLPIPSTQINYITHAGG